MSREALIKRRDETRAKIEALTAKIEPLQTQQKVLHKIAQKIEQQLSDLDLEAGDFLALFKNTNAWKQMQTYSIEFQEAEHEYQGMRPAGFLHDTSNPNDYKPLHWNFDMTVREDADLERAEKFISTHIQHFELLDVRGLDNPIAHFGVSTDEGGLDWLGWDGTHWYAIRFVYGRVRDARPLASLREGLLWAQSKQKRNYEDDD